MLNFKEGDSSYIDAEGKRQYEIVLETEGFRFGFYMYLTDTDPEVIKDQALCDQYVREVLLANLDRFILYPKSFHEDYKLGTYAEYAYITDEYIISGIEYHISYQDWRFSSVNDYQQQVLDKLKEW